MSWHCTCAQSVGKWCCVAVELQHLFHCNLCKLVLHLCCELNGGMQAVLILVWVSPLHLLGPARRAILAAALAVIVALEIWLAVAVFKHGPSAAVKFKRGFTAALLVLAPTWMILTIHFLLSSEQVMPFQHRVVYLIVNTVYPFCHLISGMSGAQPESRHHSKLLQDMQLLSALLQKRVTVLLLSVGIW